MERREGQKIEAAPRTSKSTTADLDGQIEKGRLEKRDQGGLGIGLGDGDGEFESTVLVGLELDLGTRFVHAIAGMRKEMPG